ncbi:MAG: hypothetical protein LBF51_00385 [Zoogloeaceae bacterium]|jgi:hypothetical protein|nr:hypothetical protein [Zoogloeaceae bacterium]
MRPRFFRLVLCLAGALAFPALHAAAVKGESVCTDDIYTNCASEERSLARNTRLRPFRDEVIVAGKPQDAERKTRAAIIDSAQRLKWKVIEDKPAGLRLQLDVRRHRAVIDIKIKGGGVDVDYVSSVNLNYEKDDKGNERIHPNYHKWIQKLLKVARKSAKSL